MHAILLNIRHGGGLRSQSLLDWLTASTPDGIVLSEWRDNASGGLIKKGLEAKGFYVATAANRRSNGILMAAKDGCQSQRVTPLASEKGELLLAKNIMGGALLAAYFPQGKAKGPFFKSCIEEAVRFRCVAVPFTWRPETRATRIFIETETEFRLRAQTCLTLCRQKQGFLIFGALSMAKKEWSCRSATNGFRVDHAFANAAFRKRFATVSCRYDHTPRDIGLSDHSALILK